MKLTHEEQMTISAYSAVAAKWADAHDIDGFLSSELKKFHMLLPQGRVIEIGCGGGRDAKVLIGMGYEYFGIDPVAELVAIAQHKNPTGRFAVQSVYDVSSPEGEPFDGFWACTSLLHVPKSRIGLALQAIHSVIKPGAIGFISLQEGDDQSIVKENEYGQKVTRYFAYYQQAEFGHILQENGLHLIEQGRIVRAPKRNIINFFVQSA